MCWSYNRQYGARYLAVMPTNLYGPGDNYDPQGSHVLPALIRKIHEAKAAGARQVAIWGSGTPRREFMHADDLARALMFLVDLDQKRFRGADRSGGLSADQRGNRIRAHHRRAGAQRGRSAGF